MYVDILLQVDVAIVVELKGCATTICQSLIRRIPDVHLGVFVTESSKTLLVTCLRALSENPTEHLDALRALLKIHLAVHWLDSPCESLELSLQWVEESVVGSDSGVLGSELVVLRLHLQGNRVVLLVSCACWCLVQLVWMCNLKTCCQDTVAVQECGCAIVLLLRRCHAKHLCRILPGACLHVHHLRLQHVVTLNVAILCIGVGRIHVILHSPCRTIDIIFTTCCRNRIVRQEVRLVIDDITRYRLTLMVLQAAKILCYQSGTSEVRIIHGLDAVHIELRHEHEACEVASQRNHHVIAIACQTRENEVLACVVKCCGDGAALVADE